MSTFHLRGLDGLRAIAATAVVIGHMELLKKDNGFANYFEHVNRIGHLSVVLFFVLSGFLITTLLLREKQKDNTVSIKNFYVRRILRVWPLYYLILILGLLIFSYRPESITLILCFTVFPNIAHALGHAWLVSPQLWSIGVEEQFYLVWPHVMKSKRKLLLPFVLGVFLILPILPHAIQFLLARVHPDKALMETIENIFEVLKFDCMAVGAILAVLFYKKNKWLFYIINIKPLAWVLTITPLVLWFTNTKLGMFSDTFYSILFAGMIISIINSKLSVIFDFQPLKFLGKISYGIYMYHWIVILLVLDNLNDWFTPNTTMGNIMFYSLILAATILISTVSYYFVEKKLLDLKSRFSSE